MDLFGIYWECSNLTFAEHTHERSREMRIRIVNRGEGKVQLMAEQASRKGKRVTAGRLVALEDVRDEAGRLVREVRGEVGTE